MATTNTETINKIAVSVARIEERMIRYEETSIELSKAIKGNGKPGLLDRVSVIEDCHKHEKEQREQQKEVKTKRYDFSTKVILILITMVVSNVGVLLFSIFK